MTIYASTLRIAPTSNSQAGTYPVTLEVYDGFSSSFSTFSLTVIPVEFMTPFLSSIILSLNNIGPPVFSKQLEALTVFEGEIAKFTLPTASDPDMDPFTTSVSLGSTVPFAVYHYSTFIFSPTL